MLKKLFHYGQHLKGHDSTTTGKQVFYEPFFENFMFNSFERYQVIYYKKSESSPLAELCDLYGSDKGEMHVGDHPYPWKSHTYTDFYERQFSGLRLHFLNVFECGIGTNNPSVPSNMGANGIPGASLRVWRDYFPGAHIYGADIDRSILFKEDRISTFYCDQLDSKSISDMWEEISASIEFDLMIDDGLHTFEAGTTFFENSYWKLKSGGFYIVEDVRLRDIMRFSKYFDGIKLDYDIVCLHRDSLPLGTNSLIVIRKQ